MPYPFPLDASKSRWNVFKIVVELFGNNLVIGGDILGECVSVYIINCNATTNC